MCLVTINNLLLKRHKKQVPFSLSLQPSFEISMYTLEETRSHFTVEGRVVISTSYCVFFEDKACNSCNN